MPTAILARTFLKDCTFALRSSVSAGTRTRSATDLPTLRELRQQQKCRRGQVPVVNQPSVYHDGLLFYVTERGIANCIDAKTGERVWQDRVGGVYSASPIAVDGKIYLFSETGEGIVLKPGRTPRVLARNKLEGRIIASPAVSDGRIFVRTDRELIAIQAK